MSEELKPCPFCGNTKMLVYEEKGRFGFTEWIVECDSHYCACQPTAHDSYQTKEEAVEAWNTRAERTCRNVYDETKMLACSNGFECSNCGEKVEDCEGYHVKGIWNYCPNCGSKVVE